MIGAVMILGAIYVRYLGGAFEANKLLTGIVAIPLGTPFILGIAVKKPGVYSAMLSIFAGILVGIVLNAVPSVSWEWATLIEIVVCLVLYFVPVLFSKNRENTPALQHFFDRISTPVKEDDKPVITHEYKKAIILLFAISIIIAGLLFVGMSIPSLHLYSGQLSFGAGCFCFLCAGVMWLYVHKTNKKSK
jgi:MFS family permease